MVNFKFKIVLILSIVSPNGAVVSQKSTENLLQLFEKSLSKQILNIDLSKELLENFLSSTDELISKNGYPVETHFVTTEDGYILQLHRIPRSGGKPFLLMHGFEDSSSTFIVYGPEKAPAYYLWEKGYDVWLGNIRGNTYSRNHTSLDPNKREFWNFSFHEMGIYDLPAMIDYILNISSHPKLTYAGHSQGTTIFFVMCIRRPEYNKKVNVMHAMAPIAFVGHMYSTMRPLSIFFLNSPDSHSIYEFLPSLKTYHRLCFNQEKVEPICAKIIIDRDFLYTIIAREYMHVSLKKLPIIYGHVPAGTALKVLRHFIQLTSSKRFCEFDFGSKENFANYGQAKPPEYDLSKIKVPIALYGSYADTMSVPLDVDRLETELGKNVVARYKILGLWTHNDFLWATDVNKVIFDRVLNISSKFESNNIYKNIKN